MRIENKIYLRKQGQKKVPPESMARGVERRESGFNIQYNVNTEHVFSINIQLILNVELVTDRGLEKEIERSHRICVISVLAL